MPCRPRGSLGRATGSAIWLLLTAALVLLAAPALWWATDSLEADDAFCNSCHLPSGKSLHAAITDDFDERPPASLAARHAALEVSDRPDSPNIRCIDCHGGNGLLGRAKVKLLSAKDTILYLIGQFESPKSMSWPLSDRDCLQCHEVFRKKGEGFEGNAFHDKQPYDADFDVACVECHAAHDSMVDPRLWFLRPDPVRARCAECHLEFAQR